MSMKITSRYSKRNLFGVAIAAAITLAAAGSAVAGNPNSRIANVPKPDRPGGSISGWLDWLTPNKERFNQRAGENRGGAKIGQSSHFLRLPSARPVEGWIWEQD